MQFARKPETAEQRQNFEKHTRRIQDKTHRPIADALYHQIFNGVNVKRVDEIPVDEAVSKSLDILGVDFYLLFPNETILAGQEKYLSASCASFRTVTISEHSWKHCAAQVYFCGYLTADGKAFNPWVLLNWTTIMLETAQKKIAWRMTPSHTVYPSFWHTKIDLLPSTCIIASKL